MGLDLFDDVDDGMIKMSVDDDDDDDDDDNETD